MQKKSPTCSCATSATARRTCTASAYTMQDKRIIYAVIKLTEIAKIKELVNKIDPGAFMIISDARKSSAVALQGRP